MKNSINSYSCNSYSYSNRLSNGSNSYSNSIAAETAVSETTVRATSESLTVAAGAKLVTTIYQMVNPFAL